MTNTKTRETPVHLIGPGQLVSFLHYDNGTCLGFGRVVSHSDNTMAVRTARGVSHVVTAHPDFVSHCPMNGVCDACGCEVYVSIDQYRTAIDNSGDTGCFASRSGHHVAR